MVFPIRSPDGVSVTGLPTVFPIHALWGHRIPAQGANPGNPPGKTIPRSEGTPHRLRASELGSESAFTQPITC